MEYIYEVVLTSYNLFCLNSVWHKWKNIKIITISD